MTRAQFAMALGTSGKWVHNAEARLGGRVAYTPAAARRLAVARAIQALTRMSLRAAYEVAGDVLGEPMPASGSITIAATEGGSVTLDLRRALSTFAARFGRAVHHTPRRPGRRPNARGPARRDGRRRARDYGIDLTLIDGNLARPRAERLRALDANAPFLAALGARRRGTHDGAA